MLLYKNEVGRVPVYQPDEYTCVCVYVFIQLDKKGGKEKGKRKTIKEIFLKTATKLLKLSMSRNSDRTFISIFTNLCIS